MISMRLGRVLAVIGIATLVASCDGNPLLPRAEADFATMRTLWAAQRPANYDLDISSLSEWVSDVRWRVQVRNHVAVMAVDASTGEPLPEQGWRRLSVDSLYALAESFLGEEDVLVETRFEPRDGVLTSLFIDHITYVDDSFSYRVLRLHRR